MEDFFVKIGLKIPHIITGVLAGLVGLIFGERATKTFKDKVKITLIVIVGAIMTGYFTPLIFLWKPRWESVEHSIAFVIGLLGMGVVEGILNIINRFSKHPIKTVREVKGVSSQKENGGGLYSMVNKEEGSK